MMIVMGEENIICTRAQCSKCPKNSNHTWFGPLSSAVLTHFAVHVHGIRDNQCFTDTLIHTCISSADRRINAICAHMQTYDVLWRRAHCGLYAHKSVGTHVLGAG
jgi:hypothetical protein